MEPMPEKAKGKGKDVGTPEESAGAGDIGHNGQTGGGDDLLARIAKSATSLPSALFSKGNMAGAVSGLGNGEKGGGSRSAAAVARATENLERVGESSAPLHSASHGGETIRSAQIQGHVAMQEASFAAFLDTTEPLTAPEGAGVLEGAWNMRGNVPSSTVPATNNQWTHSFPASTVAEQEARDGQEVVALLRGDLDLDAELAGPEENTILPDDMASLRKALFGNDDLGSSSSPIAWDHAHALNFIPLSLLGFDSVSTAPSTRDLLGTADVTEGWETWIDQWSRVLTGYHDEIWGDLGALVEEAKKEVKQLEEVKPGERPPEPTALLRLRAILGHLRGA
ncbi:hypothetical protein NEUTE1DRAFT_149109 [Neurospora tetrasperma FGSC 2508]|uniref:Uncharacterized protein n=1 Tax=Neurospora tetrasperma (strain FGSC 2508 / ATCC MYA-4615 / P0657) TaxID=510951 RepID=F8MXT9_NEUT8|nr:uncharacterized protein NEUTE1DRAFT_149109 [Neurospora tetrasperma FGSC 2508]EGO53884.1 hypothetical protein NEUTE1DRAFT_149109 [Neurospora tetrasperma FGSC 2508]